MSTRLDDLDPANTYPVRLGRRERKLLTEVKAEIDESVAAGVAAIAVASGQATTGTGADAGKITIAGMTATGQVIVTAAEALGNNIVISHVVAGDGIITVFAQNTNVDGAAAELDSKLVNYIVISKS